MQIFKSKKQSAPCMVIFITLLVLGAVGCTGGRGKGVNPYDYGNPEYKSMKDIPEAHDEVMAFKDPPTPEIPDRTADEYEALGDAMLKKGSLHIAFLQYERSLEKQPDNIRVAYKIGKAYLMGNKMEEAEQQFWKVLEKDPQHASAWEGMGRVYFARQAYHEAEGYFFKALTIEKGLWRSHNFLGYIYDAQGHQSLAAKQYVEALAIRPRQGSIYNNLGVAFSMDGRYLEAAEAFQAAIKMNYTEPKVYNNLGLALAKLELYDQALEVFIKGVGEAQAYNNMGCIYLNDGDYANAIASFEKAIEIEPHYYVKAGKNLQKAKKAAQNM